MPGFMLAGVSGSSGGRCFSTWHGSLLNLATRASSRIGSLRSKREGNMVKKLTGRFLLGRSERTVHGSVMPIFAVMAVPLALSVGVGVDVTRLTLARADLQSAVDGAALAGATAAGSQSASNADATARSVAKTYFSSSAQGPSVATNINDPTKFSVTPATTASGYNVTVSASATMQTAFMGLANLVQAGDYSKMNISAHATASNPVISGSTAQQPQPVVSTGNLDVFAWDFNSAYLYAVPVDASGTPHYDQYPPISQFYEINTNCNQTSVKWSNLSRCNGLTGAVIDPNQVFPIVASNQPLAILMVNMTDGLVNTGDSGYGSNAYGATPGSWQLFTTATMALGQPPSQLTDNTLDLVKKIIGSNPPAWLTHSPTNYAARNQQSLNNCMLEIQQVDPNKTYTDPPFTRTCFSSTDPNDLTPGKQFANLTCDQMAGRTFMYWFNDMGGNVDDLDYKNIVFHLRCVPGATNPNGGAIGSGSKSTTIKPTVSLLK